MYRHRSQSYGRPPHGGYTQPHVLDPTHRPGPEFLYRPPYVPEVPYDNSPYGPHGSFRDIRRNVPPSYAPDEHGVMPEINWSRMPPPHSIMTNSGYMRYDPAGTGHMMGAASLPETMSYYNEAPIVRRHELSLTQPTNAVHDEIRKMRRDNSLTHEELVILLNENPENRVARNNLARHLREKHTISATLFQDMYHDP